jgi:hypothetical protein
MPGSQAPAFTSPIWRTVSHPAQPDPSTAIFTTADGVRIVSLRGDLDKDAREPVHETR